MKRMLYMLLLSALLLALVPATYAQDFGIESTDVTWQARYWNNTSRGGNPILTRSENVVKYASTTGAFAPGVNADGFSARYEKYIDVTAGTYRFTVTADDGVRVYVDDKLVIDKWVDQVATTYSVDLPLTAGYHYVVVDYYENRGGAQLQFDWGPIGSVPTPGVWNAAFWNNNTLSGTPNINTTVSEVNFDWAQGAPLSGINADNFSARFARTVDFQPGTYRFYATADDGIRLYVAGRSVIDKWRVGPATTYTYDMYIPGGNTEVRVEYYEAGGNAVAKVRWERLGNTSTPATPTPVVGGGAGVNEIIVEDGSSGFVTGGSPTGWRKADEGSGGRLTWTRNNRERQPNYNWVRWYPELTAGRYEVFAYIPERYTTTANANYWVAHRDGYSLVKVNQSANGSKWVSLGTYTFQGSDADYVSLNDITGEEPFTQLIAFDAMKFVQQ